VARRRLDYKDKINNKSYSIKERSNKVLYIEYFRTLIKSFSL